MPAGHGTGDRAGAKLNGFDTAVIADPKLPTVSLPRKR